MFFQELKSLRASGALNGGTKAPAKKAAPAPEPESDEEMDDDDDDDDVESDDE